MDTTLLYIKNMVCDRCITAVRDILDGLNMKPLSVQLGVAQIGCIPDAETTAELSRQLSTIGFKLIGNRREQTVEQIKNAVIEMVHYDGGDKTVNLSDHIANHLNADYSSLSRLFSETTGQTIERFFILQRIERVKELLQYGELSLSQIAMLMNYSSTAYLSTQFKNITGMTPSQYKAQAVNGRKQLDLV